MAGRPAAAVLTRAAKAAEVAGLSDRELLRRFAEAGDQAAFAAVAGRHAGMVLGVCHRALGRRPDAEDACQAVFLVLARKAGAVRWQPSAANWLYATARRVAGNARRAAARRAAREGAAAVPEAVPAADALTARELVAALDEELARLPPRYREPLVLCYLEGLTRDEAAARLGVPETTLKSQLERGRKKLADALTARGCGLGAALLATAASSAGAPPPDLVPSILAGVGGSPSAPAAALAQGVGMTGTLSTAKTVGLGLVGAAVLGLGFAAVPTAAEPPQAADKMDKPAPKPAARPDGPKADAKERVFTGKVVGPDGKPVAAELVLAWYDGPTEVIGRANPDGTFRAVVPLRNPGAYLIARAPGHGLDFVTPSPDAPAEVTLRLPKDVPVRGRVVDAQGKPVAGAVVAVASLGVYEQKSPDAALKAWADEKHNRGIRLPFGDRVLTPVHDPASARAKRSPFVAATDADGRFALTGLGAERIVELKVTAAGLADTSVGVFTRAEFDPRPFNTPPDPAMREFSFGYFALPLHGPEPAVVAEPEKLIRGAVTDPDGKPRAGVTVTFSRTSERELNPARNAAVTGPDGRYTIRGAKKHPRYMVEVGPDPAAGLLPHQAFADDTVGYEPVTVDLKPGRGVVVTGTVREKGTGNPVPCQVRPAVLLENPHAGRYPTFAHSAGAATGGQEAADGRYRVVTIPGPVLLMAGPVGGDDGTRYRPAKPDPAHPRYFFTRDGALMYYGLDAEMGFVGGSWCKVIDAKPGDRELAVDVELEPAARTAVKVEDADGRPVAGAWATGRTHRDFEDAQKCEAATLAVFNVEGERRVCVAHPGRRLVGTLTVKEGDKGAVIRLAPGGVVTGRAVGRDGKPLAGEAVVLQYLSRDVSEASQVFDGPEADGRFESRKGTAGPDGAFRFDAVFPGESFYLVLFKGRKPLTDDFDRLPKHTVAKPGDTLDLGTVKAGPADGGD